jgi:hypothetical protein
MAGWLIAIVLAAGPSTPDRDTVTDSVKLRYVHPARLAPVLKLPFDLEQITLNFKDRTVTVRGSRKAVLSTLEQVLEADVNIDPLNFQVGIRIVKRTVDADGKATESMVNDSSASVTAGNPLTFVTGSDEASGQTLVILLSLADAGMVTLDVTMNMRDQAGNVLFTSKKERKVKIGERVAIGGMTDVKDVALRDAIRRGERPKGRASYSAHYLELAVANLPAPKDK